MLAILVDAVKGVDLIPCVLLGDSIAVGVGHFRPECETIAQVGITSSRFISTMLPTSNVAVDSAVISLGVNDDETVDTLENLRVVRARVTAATVFWLLPGLKPQVREMILEVARESGDRVIDTAPEAGRDHLHPTGAGYQRLAAATGGEEEVAEYDPGESRAAVPRFGRRMATSAERIRGLKLARHAEMRALASRRHGASLPIIYAPPRPDRASHAVHQAKRVAHCVRPGRACGGTPLRG